VGSRKTGSNKAKKDSKAHQDAVAGIQANEAKEVRPTAAGIESSFKENYKKNAGSKYSGKLADAMANANFNQSRLGDMKRRGVLGVMDPLGRSGLPGEYNVTPGGMQDTVRGTLGYKEYGDLGKMVDRGLIAGRDMNQLKPNSLAGFANLNEQAAANRMFGLNPTKGMGILDSLRYGFTNPTSQRQFQQLGNIGKGIMNLMPGRMLGTALLNKIPGVNIPSQFAMTEPTPFNIGPGFSEFPNRFDMFSNPELEGMTENAIYSRLFNDVAPVQTGMFDPMINTMPMQKPDVYQFTGGTPPFTIHDNFKIDPSIYDPNKNIGLDPDQVGRDIMVNPKLNINSIAANQITDPNSVMNQAYNEMGVDQSNQQMGQAITDTFPSYGAIPDMFPD